MGHFYQTKVKRNDVDWLDFVSQFYKHKMENTIHWNKASFHHRCQKQHGHWYTKEGVHNAEHFAFGREWTLVTIS